MQTRDHRLLGNYVLERCNLSPGTICRRMFLLGCVEPDWNLVTYTRGSIKYQFFHGHNAENARKHLTCLIKKLLASGVRTPLQWFRFGAVLHYLADSFTFVHNRCFSGSLKEHRLYEKLLHDVFVKYLCTQHIEEGPAAELTHGYYLTEQRSFRTDCRYITGAALALCSRLSIFEAHAEQDPVFTAVRFKVPENGSAYGWEQSLECFEKKDAFQNVR